MFDTFSYDAQEALDRFRTHWEKWDAAPIHTEGRIAIVGLPDAGKKTLCNSLWGWPALANDLPDDTLRPLGLFTLVNLPDNAYDESTVIYQLENADLIIYLLDAKVGPKAEDIRWIARLRALPTALIIVLNKADLVGEALTPEALTAIQDRFARPVITLNAQDMNTVHEQFLPQVLKACPHLTIPLASEITSLRWRVVGRMIRESAIISGLVTLENGATVDVRALLDLQQRLVRQIARVYGYAAPDENGTPDVPTVAQRLLLDTAAQFISRFGPLGRGLAASLIGASGTWTVGRTTQVHYTGETPLPHLTRLFHRNGKHGSPQGGS